MKSEISKIRADGGGDAPEMCLSGLQVLCFVAFLANHLNHHMWILPIWLERINIIEQGVKAPLFSNILFLPQLALTGAPSSSYIYVFTDAPAKDKHLEKTITALIRSTKSTVTWSIFVAHGVLAIQIFTSPSLVSHFSISRHFFSGIFHPDCIVTASGVLWHCLGLRRSSHWGLQVQHLSSHWHYYWHLYFSPGMISVLLSF